MKLEAANWDFKTRVWYRNLRGFRKNIVEKIYLIRGQKVMLDKDLAEMYGVGTSYLNRSVKRNLTRFPEDFMFQLSREEFKNLIFQIGISSSWGGTRKPPYVLLNKELRCCQVY